MHLSVVGIFGLDVYDAFKIASFLEVLCVV